MNIKEKINVIYDGTDSEMKLRRFMKVKKEGEVYSNLKYKWLVDLYRYWKKETHANMSM